MKPYKKLQTFWDNLIGDEVTFSMESRIFNAVTIFAVVLGSVNGIINIALGLILYGLLMIPLIGVLFLSYYLSRYKNRLNLAVGISAISFNLLCGGTYFAASASNGVNLFTFILIVFILTLVSSKKQFWIWIPLNILVILTLVTLEYLYPSLVENLYSSSRLKLVDLTQTLFEVIMMIVLITLFIKKSYNRERELAQTRLIALEESNATKNKLFSIVAHDLKAPLASIENYLSLLSELEFTDAEKATIEKNLLASTRQTSEMLHSILSWSTDQMKGSTINLMSIKVHEALNHTINFQNNLAKQKEITLNYQPDLEMEIIADPDMLQLIIRNLLNNAIKFTNPGGKIELKVEEKENKCIIIISDNGIGMSEEKMKEIFSYQNTATYGTNHEKGVGLGLNLAKTYVEMQHGKIWLESKKDEGSTFYVSFPKA